MKRLTTLEAQVFARICELIDRDGVGFVDELVWPDRYQLAGVLGALEKKGLVGTDAIDGPMNDNAGRLQLDITDKGEEIWEARAKDVIEKPPAMPGQLTRKLEKLQALRNVDAAAARGAHLVAMIDGLERARNLDTDKALDHWAGDHGHELASVILALKLSLVDDAILIARENGLAAEGE